MENSNNSRDLPSPDLYRTTRAQIEHFDNSINQRVIWLSIGQSFFFNVYAILITAKAPLPELEPKIKMITLLFPIAAFLTAIFTLFDVVATMNYLRKLRKNYEKATDGEIEDTVYPPIFGYVRDRLFQHLSPVLIPLVFIFTWIYVIFS